MKKPVLLLLATALTSMAFGQPARIVFNVTAGGQPYMVWNPSPVTTAGAFENLGAYLVIDNPNNNALYYQPANTNAPVPIPGIMRTEAAQNKVRWAIGSSTGIYRIPYANEANVAIPFELDKVGVVGAGSFVFSTYSYYSNQSARPWAAALATPTAPGAEWDNRNYMAPAGVTHMNDYTLGVPDNSQNAVNRFWTVHPNHPNAALWTNYVTPPMCNLTFTHANTEVDAVAPADAIITGAAGTDLFAQRFNTTTNKWGDWLPAAWTWTGGAITGRVSGVQVIGANFFPSWTLSSSANPLPIELTSYNGTCDDKKVKLMWSTASEQNNAFFTIEKSRDNVEWTEIGEVEGVGNSSSATMYSFEDEETDGLAYYKLSQTDQDGTERELGVVAAGCDAHSTEIVNTWDDGSDLNIVVSSTDAAIYDLILTDAQGKVMVSRPAQAINAGYTPLRINTAPIATGIYVVTLQNAQDVMTRRVMVN